MEALRNWLIATGISQAALARDLDVSQPCVSDWVTGQSFPTLANLRKLSTRTGLSLDELASSVGVARSPPRPETTGCTHG